MCVIRASSCRDFGELKAVPTTAVIDDHLEPSRSTTLNAAGISDDPSFVDLFRVCIIENFPFCIFYGRLSSISHTFTFLLI